MDPLPHKYFVAASLTSGSPNPRLSYTNAIIEIRQDLDTVNSRNLREIEEEFRRQFDHSGVESVVAIGFEPLYSFTQTSPTISMMVSAILVGSGQRIGYTSEIFALTVDLARFGTIELRQIEAGFEQSYAGQGVEKATVVGLRLLRCDSMALPIRRK